MIQNALCNLQDDVHSLISQSHQLFTSWNDDKAVKFKNQGLDSLQNAWSSYSSEMTDLDAQLEIMKNRIERSFAACERLSRSV